MRKQRQKIKKNKSTKNTPPQTPTDPFASTSTQMPAPQNSEMSSQKKEITVEKEKGNLYNS